MKRNWKLLLLIALLSGAIAYGGAITPTTEVTFGPVQSVYQDGNTAVPDSMRVSVFRNSSQVFDDWFNSGDLDCSVWNTHWLIFSDAFQDIDGAGGDGHYSVMVMAYDFDSTLYTPYYWSFEVGVVFDPVNDAVATVTTTGTATSVTGLAAGAIGVGDFATGAITADAIATDAIGAAEWAAGTSAELYTYFGTTGDMALGADITPVASDVANLNGFNPATTAVVLPSATETQIDNIETDVENVNGFNFVTTPVVPADTSESGTDFVMVDDSTAFQGGANSLTLADIKYWMGLYLTMWPGCKAYYDVSANYDDIHLVDTLGDTIVTQRWHHVGGAAGDTPDTVRGIAP